MKIDDFNFENMNGEFDEKRFVFGNYDNGYAIYEGMLDIKTKLPSGLGRLIWNNHEQFRDGQFLNNNFHGLQRVMWKSGQFHYKIYSFGKWVQNIY